MIGYSQYNKRDGIGDFPYDPTSTGIISALTEDALSDSVSKASGKSVDLLQRNAEILVFLKECSNDKYWVYNAFFGKRHIKYWAREILKNINNSGESLD